MTDDPNAEMPRPLRDFLVQAREANRQAAAAGVRRTVINVRESFEKLTRTFVTDVPDVALIRDEVIPGPDYSVPVRIYHPEPERELPVALFLHGGGHVSGSVSMYDPLVRKLALAARQIVVAVEYRLAPECPYPAGLKDTIVSAKRVFEALRQLDLRHEPRLALIGDSGGGALSATVAHLAQFDSAIEIERQVLLYPSLDYTLSKPSVREHAEGCLLEHDRILWLFDAYLQNAENRRAVSPLFMDVTDAYPPTLIITAPCDPLRDEAIAYAQRLKQSGIDAEHRQMPGMVHAYLNLEDLVPDACQQTYEWIRDFLAS
jgi:acetyl esterase/lipase